tara:strand:- start:148 stop:354 length:207 start_codon:yes stop_codon:yes gene_type:complete
MWLSMVLVCSSPFADTCNVMMDIEKMHETEINCFKSGNIQVKYLSENPVVYYAIPLCQKIKIDLGKKI